MSEISQPAVRGIGVTGVEQAASDVYTQPRNQKLREQSIAVILYLCAFVTVLTTIGIILSLFIEAIGFFLRPETNLIYFLTGSKWNPLASNPSPDDFGALPLLTGTFMITVLSATVAIPLGTGAAVYLSEYAAEQVRNVLKPLLEILAGIPSVVYGYFALSLISPLLRATVDYINAQFSTDYRVDFLNSFNASIVLGVMIIPLVASLAEDSMRSVPRSLREGAYALGANKMEVSTRVIVPAALSGIIAGYILAISRAVGETMIVAVAAGATPRVTLNPFQSVQTMTGFIVQVSFGDNPVGSLSSQTIFAVGATLFVLTFVMNIISDRVMKRFREEYD